MVFHIDDQRTTLPISYRGLTHAEIAKLCEIDRSETRDGHYMSVAGQLEYVEQPWVHPGFSPDEVSNWTSRLCALLAQGGVVIGALLHNTTLVGIVAVHNQARGPQGDRRRLEFFHISRSYRGQGIGKRLLFLAKEATRAMGARQLYITGSPTPNTVEFYLYQGCRLTTEIDPELFAEEPCDIHLELDVRE